MTRPGVPASCGTWVPGLHSGFGKNLEKAVGLLVPIPSRKFATVRLDEPFDRDLPKVLISGQLRSITGPGRPYIQGIANGPPSPPGPRECG